MTILDTLIGQARTKFSRAYLTSGLIPSAALLLGWRLYAGGFARLEQDLGALIKDTRALTTSAILYGLVLLAVGGMFFFGRTWVLHLFQAVPGRPLGILRQYLMEAQIARWWTARRRVIAAEDRLTPLMWAADGDFAPRQGSDIRNAAQLAEAMRATRDARARVVRLAGTVTGDEWHMEESELPPIVRGLTAYYAAAHSVLDPSASAADRTAWAAEQQAWKTLYAEPQASDLLQRLRGELLRELLAATAAWLERPDDERWLAPTRLGNRVAALDDYAEKRYAIGTSTLWVRLWGVLDDKERQSVTEAQLSVETLANLSAAFGILFFAIVLSSSVGGFLAYRAGADLFIDWRTVAYALATWILTVASYRGAVFAFGVVAERITRLVDLHRLKLITAVGYKPPQTVSDEVTMLSELNGFYTSAKPRQNTRALVVAPVRTPGTPGRSSSGGALGGLKP